MSQPFRDEYAAALDRAERLAEENEDLRREVARVRVSPAAASPAPEGPPDSLKARTLERLDELSTQIDAHQVDPPGPAASQPSAPLAMSGAPTAAPMLPLQAERSEPIAFMETRDVPLLRIQAQEAEARALAAEARVKRLTSEVQRLVVRSNWMVVIGAVLLVLAVALAMRR